MTAGAVSAKPAGPGAGWPGDPATAATLVATDAESVRRLAAEAGTLAELTARQSVCRACPRLVDWREQVAAEKRKSFRDEPYWGRPVPGWGAQDPGILIIGLAPAAHGGNRTGRIFTGDRSGDVLFESLWRCGLATQPTSVTAGDGQRLLGVRMMAAVRCAPPDNKPSIAERDTCEPWLAAEFDLVAQSASAIVCLGHFAWAATWRELARAGYPLPRPRPAFGHGVEVLLPASPGRPQASPPGPGPAGSGPSRAGLSGVVATESRPVSSWAPVAVLGCYHPSQQNTFTGRVTGAMLDDVFTSARRHAGSGPLPDARRSS